MDELERMALEAEKYTRGHLEKKKAEVLEEMKDYEFRNLLDAVELLYELRAKREKSVKDQALIDIIEQVLREEPFEYMDEDFILSAYKDGYQNEHKIRSMRW